MLVVGGDDARPGLTLFVVIGEGNGMHLADDVLTLSGLRVGRCGLILPAGGKWDEEECREGKRYGAKEWFHRV